MKHNLSGMNIIVRNNRESDFVLKLAKKSGYKWRETDRALRSKCGRLSRIPYRDEKNSFGEFVYCFDFRTGEEGVLSHFSASEEYYDDKGLKQLIQINQLIVTEAGDLIKMSRKELNLFMILR
jgi:hypothetical protein